MIWKCPKILLSFVAFSLVNAMAATLLWVLGLEDLFPIVVLLGSIAAAFGIAVAIFDWRSARFGSFASAMMLGGYFGGHLLFLAFGLVLQENLTPYWYIRSYAHVRTVWLLEASAITAWSAALVAIMALLERPLFVPDPHSHNSSRRPLLILAIALGVTVAAYLSGAIGYMGIQTSLTGAVPPIGAIARLISPSVGLTALYLGTREKHRFRRNAYYLLFVLALILMIPFGRRPVLYSLIIAFAIWAHQGGFRHRGIKKLIKVAGASSGAIIAAFIIFFTLRYAEQVVGIHPLHMTTLQRITTGIPALIHQPIEIISALIANVGPRVGSLLPYLASYAEGLHSSGPLEGRVTSFNVALVVPSALWPGKRAFLEAFGPVSEVMIHNTTSASLYTMVLIL